MANDGSHEQIAKQFQAGLDDSEIQIVCTICRSLKLLV